MQRVVFGTFLTVLLGLPASVSGVDLNGRWRFESDSIPNAIVQVVQSGSALSIPWGLPFAGTVGAPDANGFTGYQVSWTDGTSQAGFGGRIMPSGNLLDGRGGYVTPGTFPTVAAVTATRCTCFDGNDINGDGCDSSCQIEPCWTCSGDPSLCNPTPDGGACDDGSACTSGETCAAGVCGGGAPIMPCFDISGPWTRHIVSTDLSFAIDYAALAIQRGTDLRIGSAVGSIDPTTGTFDLRTVNPNLFCNPFDPLAGSVAADGLTYSATGTTQVPNFSAPDQCGTFDLSEIGDHCGNGTLDGAEECDDGNLTISDGCSNFCIVDSCATCSGTPSVCGPTQGAPCDDGNACTIGDTCTGIKTCSGSPLTCEPCLACDATLGCIAQPQPVCTASSTPERSIVYVKNGSDDTVDRFLWRWNKGPDTMLSELGDPTATDDMSLCLYDESTGTPALLFRATIPAGTAWTAGASGFRYKDASGSADGVSMASLKSGVKANAKVKGKGVHLSDRPYALPAPLLPLPLRVQLRGENGLCLETRHDSATVLTNDAAHGVFKARGVP